MSVTNTCVDLIKRHEGLELDAYLCPANVPTIGYGSTLYEDGKPIHLGDTITQERAEALLKKEIAQKEAGVRKLLGKTVCSQNQVDALVSFAFNLGVGALQGSTLLKKVKANPKDTAIKMEFLKWNKARVGGTLTELKGLTKRRAEEAALYFK